MSDGNILTDAVGAGLAARAIEPHAGESTDGHTHESCCLNCGTALVGSHCHACGQAAHVHRTLGAFFHDLLHGVFHFEGKVWNTLPELVLRPGKLTREYIEGRRARYVSPLALLLFSVFVMFAAVENTAGEFKVQPDAKIKIEATTGKGLAEAQNELTALRAKREQQIAKGQDTDALDDQIDSAENAVEVMERARSAIKGEKVASTGYTLLDEAIDAGQKNPKLVVYKMQSYAYKYSWALVPMSVPFLWLLFPFSRRFHLYDHTVFVTYSLSFMTLLLAMASVLEALGAQGAAAALALVPPVHMYRQLRGAYGCSRIGAFLRAGVLALMAIIALALFLVAVAAKAGAE